MATSSLNRYPKLLDLMRREGIAFADFFLIDVGCSGGIDDFWPATLGDKLRALGFDPLVTEIERLNRENKNANTSYVEAFVVSGREDNDLKQKSDNICSRAYASASSVFAQEIKKYNYAQEKFNAGAELVFSKEKCILDDYFSKKGQKIDFIKIDTDGHDIDVLFGSESILDANDVLGISVEMQFHGLPSLESNTFSAIDIYLRRKGFKLFDVDIFRYSKRDLPAPFLYDIYAQTKTGQVVWGEGVYFRDLGDDSVYKSLESSLTRDDILKQVFLFELFGLPDCAAELINKRFKDFGLESKSQVFLDTLVSSDSGMSKTAYKTYMEKFSKDPDSFFPSNRSIPQNRLDLFKRLRRCASILLGRY